MDEVEERKEEENSWTRKKKRIQGRYVREIKHREILERETRKKVEIDYPKKKGIWEHEGVSGDSKF